MAVLAAVVEQWRDAASWSRRSVAAAGSACEPIRDFKVLREGAVVLALTGIGAGLAARRSCGQPTRVASDLRRSIVPDASCRAVVAARLLAFVDQAAATANTGHVFTIGHGYKLLDENYYIEPGPNPTFDLAPGERFAGRRPGGGQLSHGAAAVADHDAGRV